MQKIKTGFEEYLTESELYLLEHPAVVAVDPKIHNAIISDMLLKLCELRKELNELETDVILN